MKKTMSFGHLALTLTLALSLSPVFAVTTPTTLDDVVLRFNQNFRVIHENRDLNYQVDLAKLSDGDVQYSMSFTQADDFDDKDFLVLDRYNLKDMDRYGIFVASKMSYFIKGRTPDFFNTKLFSSPHYVKNTLVDTNARSTDKPNVLRVSRYINMGPINLGKIDFDMIVDELNTEADRDFLQRVLDFDVELGKPAKISALHMTNADKMLNGTYIINKYYKVGDQGTLVVSYNLSSSKKVPLPFFMIRGQAVKSALSEGRILVKSLREYEPQP